MATQDLEKLIVKLDADLRSYEKAMAKAQGVTTSAMRRIERDVQQSATKVERTIGRMGDVFKNFGKGLLVGLGVGGISELGRTIQQAVASAAKIGDLADKIGLSTDSLQALQLGTVQADMSFEDMDKTLLRFSKTLGETANGQGDYLKTLRANDQTLKGSFLDNLKQLAELVKNAKNEQEALLIITQAMGKGSDGWLEVLKKGADGINQLGKEASDTGAIVEESLIKEAQKLDDQWAAIMNRMGTYTKTFAIEAAKTLGGLFANAQKISDALRNGEMRKFLFGDEGGLSGAIGDFLLGGSSSRLSARERDLRRNIIGGETMRPAPGAGTVALPMQGPPRPSAPVTKIFNPEEDAAAKKKAAEAERELKRAKDELTRSIKRQFEAFTDDLTKIDEETAALKLQGETIGMSTGEVDRHRIAQELLNSATREGIPITDGLNRVIQQKAQAYGDAAQSLENLREAQDRVEQQQEAVKESVKGLFSDLRDGIAPVDALTNALGRLADRLVDLAIDDVFNTLTKPGATAGAGGGGILNSIMALFSHSGGVVGQGGRHRMVHPSVFRTAQRMHGGGIAGDEVATILQKGEIVLPKGFRGSAGGGSIVNVYTQPGMRAERRESRQGGMRREDLYIFMDDYVGSGRGQRTLGAMYGLTPQKKRR